MQLMAGPEIFGTGHVLHKHRIRHGRSTLITM
jgi:hypothetical protein